MNRIQILVLTGILTFVSSNLFGQLTWSPEKITTGDEVTITYDPKGTPLENATIIVVNLYQVDDNSIVVEEVSVQNIQGKFTGTFQVDESTKALLFGVGDENMKLIDNLDDKAYKTICYKADRTTPVEGAYAAKAKIVCEYGEFVSAKLDSKKALTLLEKEFEVHPISAKNIKLQSLHLGLATINKDETAIKVHEKLVNDIMTKKSLSENELSYIYKYTGRVKKDKEGAEKIKKQLIEAFPTSNYAIGKYTGKVKGAKNVSEKIEILEAWNKNFGDDQSKSSSKNFIISKIVAQFRETEDWVNFRKYLNMIENPTRKAMILNGTAWSMSGESIEGAAKTPELGLQFSKESLELLKSEMQEMIVKSKLFTPRQYKNRLKYSYAMYADTYALLAYKNNQIEEALAYQLIACDHNNFDNGDLNEKYCYYFEKLNGAEETEKLIASLIAKGKTTSKMVAQHKQLFMANNTIESAYENYTHQLKQSAYELLRSELKSEMINTPAPSFNLVNLYGTQVNSDDLRGKVVVVDFWATWCGPCKASFPGMQKAVDKFENSEDVEFVFIDTWESGENITEKVSDFISSNNYTFEVLMDSETNAVSSFGVRSIPTKFVIDKNGNIRFRSGSFRGSGEELVEELSLMIELSGGTIPN